MRSALLHKHALPTDATDTADVIARYRTAVDCGRHASRWDAASVHADARSVPTLDTRDALLREENVAGEWAYFLRPSNR